jgi:hypothetical protein
MEEKTCKYAVKKALEMHRLIAFSDLGYNDTAKHYKRRLLEWVYSAVLVINCPLWMPSTSRSRMG